MISTVSPFLTDAVRGPRIGGGAGIDRGGCRDGRGEPAGMGTTAATRTGDRIGESAVDMDAEHRDTFTEVGSALAAATAAPHQSPTMATTAVPGSSPEAPGD